MPLLLFIGFSSNHLLVLATSCIMYNLVPTPHSIPDYILITSAGTPGWLPVLGSQPADDAPPVTTTATTAPICCFQHIIHRIVTLYTGYWINCTAGAGTQSTVTSASQRRRRRQKYLLYERAFITSPRRNVTRHVGAGPAAQMFTVCFSGRIHFIRRGVIAILIVRCCKVEVQRARM